MIRAVLDTNTLVSGLGWAGAARPAMWSLAGQFEIVTSPALLDELERVLHYPKLKAATGNVAETVTLVALVSIVVEPTQPVDLVRDPDDNRVLEAALAGDADVVVTPLVSAACARARMI